MAKTPRRNFRIEDKTWEQFVSLAQSNNTSGSTLLREFIINYINNNKEE